MSEASTRERRATLLLTPRDVLSTDYPLQLDGAPLTELRDTGGPSPAASTWQAAPLSW
jgi:hypothetical protein